jgi:tetratricopeptide (TPR) repeat protein
MLGVTIMEPAPNPSPVVVRKTTKAAPYVPAIGPKLKIVLVMVFGIVAVLGATGFYLSMVSLLDYLRRPITHTTPFSLWVFLAHSIVGVVGALPFLAFGAYHWITAHKRPNKTATRLGIMLFFAGILVCLSGFALIQLEGLPQLPTGSLTRVIIYWLHIAVPVASTWLYVRHRQAGPKINWRLARSWGLGVGAITAVMLGLHSQDPQQWFREGPKEGAKYFEPSLSRTADGKFVDPSVLMMDSYCIKCHPTIGDDHFHSSHKFSSFNNPAYLASVRETRKVALDRDGDVKASRWCAGCHDPVPFLGGAFDDPKFDDVNHATAHAGITCTVCHAISHVHGSLGNGGYTLAQPSHYPFAQSDNTALQWLNNQMVKAKPDFHKQTFLKPFHKTAEFCATCHKVSLPVQLNHYKDFLRGQNHYDSYHLSGVSGHGARAFYYPPQAKENCAQCHMPLQHGSTDFAAKDFDNSGKRSTHNHRFPAANTGLFTLLQKTERYAKHTEGFQKTIDLHADYLRGKAEDGSDKKVRIDIFGLKPGVTTETAGLVAPLRPQVPMLQPGKSYTVEVVVRTLGVGHPLTQGTVDSNELWVDFLATSDGQEIARNGALSKPNDEGEVDRWAHFINVHMLDRNGNRINRRNPQDIFTPLYDKQVPPGAAAVLHYRLDVPATAKGPIAVTAKLRYRKFDDEYMRYVHPNMEPPKLPIIDVCSDTITFAIAGGAAAPSQTSPVKPAWQRWNDYGIGCLLEGGATAKRGHFRQAEDAFRKLLTLGEKDAVPHGHVNLARVLIEEGRFDEAAKSLDAAGKCEVPAPWWTRAWFTALVNSETATKKEHIDAVIADLEKILDPAAQPKDRKFDFTRDYVVRNRLASRFFKRSQFEAEGSAEHREYLLKAIKAAEGVLAEEAEDVEAHDLLKQCYARFAAEVPAVPNAKSTPELVAKAANAKASKGERVLALNTLAAAPGSFEGMRLDAIREAIQALRPAYHAEPDADVKTALATALAGLHREAHAAYKPDEIARSNAARMYREKHPEANYAARDRVIYPTTPAQKQAILTSGDLPPGT